MKKLLLGCMSLAMMAVALSLIAVAPAQVVKQDTASYYRMTSVIGMTVSTQQAQIGKVTDVVMTPDGCVDYLVVSYQNDFVVVPWTVATFSYEQRTVVVNVTTERLRTLVFKSGTWPAFYTPEWRQRVVVVYGEKAFRPGHSHWDKDKAPPTKDKVLPPPMKDIKDSKDVKDKTPKVFPPTKDAPLPPADKKVGPPPVKDATPPPPLPLPLPKDKGKGKGL